MQLYTKIGIGLVLGVIVGWALNALDLIYITEYTDYVGKLFIRLIKLVVVPLILASLTLGAANLGDIKKLGKLGMKTLLFFMGTTLVAVTIGISIAGITKPGLGLDEKTRDSLVTQYREEAAKKISSGQGRNDFGRALDILVRTAPTTEQKQSLKKLQTELEKKEAKEKKKPKSEVVKILDLLLHMVPTNPIASLAGGDMLAIIFFSLFLGLCITLIPNHKEHRKETLLATLDGFNEAILKMVTLAMNTAPYGVFALMVGVVANMGIQILIPLLTYGIVVVAGLFLHLILTYLSIILVYLRVNPLRFLVAIKSAMLLGFSTSSSSATLPVSMEVAKKNLGASDETSSFVLPLGATLNMDGTALYQGVAAIFIAQVYGADLTMAQQLVMILTATLASVGAAGVPGAGMITLAVVLGTANIPAEGIALIFGLDRILDMFRTSLNIVGDLTCTAVMARSEGETLNVQSDGDLEAGQSEA